MSDIWFKVWDNLTEELGSQIWKLRESEPFLSMESEIERAMAVSLTMSLRMGSVALKIGPPPTDDTVDAFYLSPQHSIGQYRVDFLFGHTKWPGLRNGIVVECDGHDWHEKTKDQAARDKARDRYLSGEVGRVLHFTGSEIWRDAGRCWLDVINVFFSMREGSQK